MKPPAIRWIAILVAVAAISLLHACSDGASPTRPENGVVKLDAEAFRFSPDDILLRPGESAVFEITSGDVRHTFTIDELMLDSEVPAGQTISVELTASAERSYAFYCAVPGHRERGMEGVITVRRSPPVSTGGTSGGATGY